MSRDGLHMDAILRRTTALPSIVYFFLKKGYGKCKSYTYYLTWTLPLITHEGDLVTNVETDAASGEHWPFADYMYDKATGGEAVAFNAELCTRLDDENLWLCSGTIKDMCDSKGQITYEGIYQDDVGGLFTITGGTADFDGATGYISDTFDTASGTSVFTVKVCGV